MMFEVLTAYEVANNEKNRFLRSIYLKYTRLKLKKIFFKNFNFDMELNQEFFDEIIQFFNSTETVEYSRHTPNFPTILNAFYFGILKIKFYDYEIKITVNDNSDVVIDVLNTKTKEEIGYKRDMKFLNMSIFREIILLAIYNYSVAYILEEKDKEKYFIIGEELYSEMSKL